ncbi:hypothetical protein FB451DRAFT_1289229 [Mycena latifolia]|nr:hypothetical protein FB451DRAFT_1289229 [Mycena latifolia]
MAEPETSNAAGLPLVPKSIPAFCEWIDSDKAPAWLADTVITDISWWYERHSLLHHEFVLLHIRYESTDGRDRLYHLRLERAGKRSGNPFALDTATFLPDGFDEPFFHTNNLFCALGSEEYMRSLHPVAGEASMSVLSAFQDFLDQKWRGPPPTLRDVVRYVRLITSRKPNYSLSHANCFWFSRNLVYILALRHYSFPFVLLTVPPDRLVRTSITGAWFLGNFSSPGAYEEPWLPHDPSTIGRLFTFFRNRERRNGSLLFHRTIHILQGIIVLAVLIGAIVTALAMVEAKPFRVKIFMVLLLAAGIVSFVVAAPVSLLVVSALNRYTARTNTRAIPEQRRGEFIPPRITITLQTERHERALSWTRSPCWPAITIPRWTVGPTPIQRRVLPEPWERDEQIYAPAKEEYLVALEQMRLSPHTVGQRRVWDTLSLLIW